MCKAIEVYGEQKELKKAIDIAINMLKANFDVTQIAALTGIPITKVEELKNGTPA